MTPANADTPGELGRSGTPSYLPSSEPVWSSRTQWGAILAGSLAGFAAFILLTTLGVALGITAGALGLNATDTVRADTAEKAATGLSIGAALWILLTALGTGLVGGWVLNSTARRDRPYSSFIFGGITWAVGFCILIALAAPGVGGMFSGLGGGVGAGAAALTGRPDVQQRIPSQRSDRALTDEEKVLAKDAADKAAAAAAAAAWVALGAQLISIAATMFSAGWRRHTGTRVVTEIRPRPAPMV